MENLDLILTDRDYTTNPAGAEEDKMTVTSNNEGLSYFNKPSLSYNPTPKNV